MKTVIIKKSEMASANVYDYKRLSLEHVSLVPCEIEEKKEELVFSFETEHSRPMTDIRKESRKNKLAVLIDVARLKEAAANYRFQVCPDNLYYDSSSRVRVLNRDVYRRGESGGQEEFLEKYKALTGYVMQRRYKYEDYAQGGLKLLEKNPFLSKVRKCEDTAQLLACLEEEYEKESAYLDEKKILVDKGGYRRKQFYLAVFAILLAASAGVIGYWGIMVVPKQNAVMAADIKYIEKDYLGIIDMLASLSVEELDISHKYILAEAYVRSENLSKEQRENIMSTLSVKGDERILRYWVHIGRLEVLEAENIAMQRSDDELLLYAYLKEKNLTEVDVNISGEAKASKLSDLDKKISELSKKYTVEEQ